MAIDGGPEYNDVLSSSSVPIRNAPSLGEKDFNRTCCGGSNAFPVHDQLEWAGEVIPLALPQMAKARDAVREFRIFQRFPRICCSFTPSAIHPGGTVG